MAKVKSKKTTSARRKRPSPKVARPQKRMKSATAESSPSSYGYEIIAKPSKPSITKSMVVKMMMRDSDF